MNGSKMTVLPLAERGGAANRNHINALAEFRRGEIVCG